MVLCPLLRIHWYATDADLPVQVIACREAGASHPPEDVAWSRGHLYRLTQLEVAGGIVATGKLGLNPGELLDFLLGWTTLDLYDDDLGHTQDTFSQDASSSSL